MKPIISGIKKSREQEMRKSRTQESKKPGINKLRNHEHQNSRDRKILKLDNNNPITQSECNLDTSPPPF